MSRQYQTKSPSAATNDSRAMINFNTDRVKFVKKEKSSERVKSPSNEVKKQEEF